MKKKLVRFSVFTVCAALAAGIAWVDYTTRESVSVAFFYLLPISAAAWYIGMRPAIFVALFSSLCWFTVDMLISSVPRQPLVPYWNGFMQMGFFLVNAVLFAILKKLLDKEKQMARTDNLTGILNRNGFYESAHLEIERAKRYSYPLTIAFIDLDNFKWVNDMFGHSRGDEVLKNVVRTIRAHTRVNDVFARIGGDEFVLLLPGVDADNARIVFTKLRNQIAAPLGNQSSVTASIGAVTFLKTPDSIEELLKKTDCAMYEVKKTVKNNVRYKTLSN